MPSTIGLSFISQEILMSTIDLRSDTITQPTPAMRLAMAEAEVGDDVFGDDPTVNCLEAEAAARMGKEAAVFVTSGTMGNLAAALSHCGRGDEAILGHLSHTYINEQGGLAAVGSIHPRAVPNRIDGTLDLNDVEAAVRTDNIHYPRSRLIMVENTHNLCNGVPLPAAYMQELGALARRHGLKVHVDGARIFNAAIALGVDVRELTADADSVTFCLSKGLGAPVGSVLCGERDFIHRARRARKVLGGGMRQAGVIAAAGLVALREMVDRLAEDHANACALADGLAEMPGIEVDPAVSRTNIVYFTLRHPDVTPQQLVAGLEQRGVRVLALGPDRLRAVTNYHVTDTDIPIALAAFAEILDPR
jgi:threonine aldolase